MPVHWQDYIEQRNDVMLGKPVFKGTRLAVEPYSQGTWHWNEPRRGAGRLPADLTGASECRNVV